MHSGPVHEPIPAHPDAIYRPQHRPTPSSNAAAPRLGSNPIMAAPLGAGAAGFSPWLIAGPLLAVLVAAVLAALAYALKKKNDSKKQREKDQNQHDDGGLDDNNHIRLQSVPLQRMKPPLTSTDQSRLIYVLIQVLFSLSFSLLSIKIFQIIRRQI